MEKLQEVLQAMIEKYNIVAEDIAVINEALLNLESPELVEGENGDEFKDPYGEQGEE